MATINKLTVLQEILRKKRSDEIIDLLGKKDIFYTIIHTGDGFYKDFPSALKIIAHYLFFLLKNRLPNLKYQFLILDDNGKKSSRNSLIRMNLTPI